MNTLKSDKVDLKRYQLISSQVGLILALILFIAVFRIGAEREHTIDFVEIDEETLVFLDDNNSEGGNEFFELISFNESRQREITPPAPPRPRIAAPQPHDEVVEDMNLGVDTELDLHLIESEYSPLSIPSIDDRIEYFLGAETLPEMITGLRELHEGITYPERARRAGIQGRVYIQFIVNQRGEVEYPEVIKGIGGGCDEVALEAVKDARFQPATILGYPIRFKMAVYINFRLIN